METGRLLVFFDGQCPFCVGWIKFLLDRDGNDRLLFARLQSEWTSTFFRKRGIKRPAVESVLVWDGQTLKQGSSAIAALTEALPGIWHLGKHIEILPVGLREGAYRLMAERRHSLFGTYKSCWVPKAEDRRKFLDLEGATGQDVPHGNEAGDDPDPHQRKRDL